MASLAFIQAGDDLTAARIVDAHLVVAYTELLGLVEPRFDVGLDVPRFNAAVRGLASVGVAGQSAPLPDPVPIDEFRQAARAARQALEACPVPELEWAALSGVLDHQLPELVGVSGSSVARYHAGQRRTPDEVAARLHVLALIVTELAGSYNGFGIRRWFTRPRSKLDHHSPADLLRGAWDPDSAQTHRVRELAASLRAVGAT